MKLIKYLFITIFFFGISNEALAQNKKDTLTVLFVGNSYTFTSNMPHLVSIISDSADVKLITSKSTAGGATLKDHWTNKKGLKTKKNINEGDYDIVVIQEHSLGTINKKDDFLNYSKKLCDLIKSSGAKPYFFVTWARQKVPQYQETITKIYEEAAKENNGKLVLVGDAWKLARSLRPGIGLYKLDGRHPSDLGSFLTACVFVNTLTSEVPKKLPNWYFTTDDNGEKITLLMEDSLDIIFCIKVASEI
ncbi:hypothetical protein [Winogradskyella sp. UBA3174]|uniref:hypothetical protein n=1 Tax=Winogradskyella sp. UBA3174 TaxID=1947785 RepID=UPI0025F2421D|nr:hypothetical protein [Winogradskyella sp. UBA3174]|tara:strand:+ start:6811 stop:7554 length:744 start_codon:yes stop_codon:yes gene_type:complete